MNIVRAILIALCLCAAPVACNSVGSFKEAVQDSRKTESDLKTELGIDSHVGFTTTSGTNGTKAFVTVHLTSTPSGDVAALKRKVTEIVTRDFRSNVDGVQLQF
jgi:hypothetical protein